ncbi:MAG TPA: metalloregulator ArsR/SmtB family transcription factor [Methylomirabilota bacterium]|jgi:DNA-binding transcriptional ArsR family regulator
MSEPDIASVASLLADPSRAAMCMALAGGEARPAGELAARAGVSAQTASNHLGKLIAGRILRVEQQGRWRYYRLASADVGHAVEALAVVAPSHSRGIAVNGMDAASWRLREARTCYSHLAGRLGVALADALTAGGWLEGDGRDYRLTRKGVRSLRELGIAVPVRQGQAPARRCLDWTERRPHVAGLVGTALADLAFERGWIRRLRGTRAVTVTSRGRVQLRNVFNVRWEETRR